GGGRMRGRGADAAGFSLVEVVIAMFLLGVIAIALLPGLINGIRYSSEQTTVATATRQLNSLIEEARRAPSCGALTTAATPKTFQDGAGRDFTTRGTPGPCVPCSAKGGIAVPLTLTATQDGRSLATVSALIYVAGAKAATPCS
ncbi:MAG: type IV pilus modification PilV family protein, partial [Microbacterium sp.]|uniref:type IV pilus modification PilV family protein n=1 Tax=Microbacterium sp. TaxID=51671 RepID=UPI003F7E96EE